MNASAQIREIGIDRIKVLVVDDEYTTRKVIHALLLAMGCTKIFEARDGESGLAAVRAVRPDLVLLECDMPGIDGAEFVRRLRAEPTLFASPAGIIMMAAHSKHSRVLEAVRLGIHEFLLKPVSSGALRARMLAALSKSSALAKSDRSEPRKLAS